MSLSKYLILMIIATLFSWAAFCIVLYSVDPFSTVTLGFILFYLSLFFALVGTLSLLGFLIRYIFNKEEFITQQVIVSFRQAIWFGILIVVGLYLQSQNLVAWWNLLILLAILVFIEYCFISVNNRTYKESH